uniref:Uncharacterized protein n=1 Tax=Anguilla anguilla TaxID=7936 RepID=A0A0E9QFS1_ANGAN
MCSLAAYGLGVAYICGLWTLFRNLTWYKLDARPCCASTCYRHVTYHG